MNLRYRDERRVRGGKSGMEGERLTTSQRLAAFAALAGGRYAWAKLSRAASVGRWADEPTHTARHRAWRLIQVAELAHGAASLANFITFLRDGKFRSPWERARARAWCTPRPTPRASSPSSTSTDSSCGRSSPSWRSSCCPSCPRARARRLAARARGDARRRRRRRGGAPVAARATPDGSAASAESHAFHRAVRGVRAVARDAPVRAGAVRPRGLLLLRGARAAKAQSGGARFRWRGVAAPRRAGCGAPSTRRASHETRRVGNSYNSNTRIEREASTARARPFASVSRFAFFIRFFVFRFSV